MLAAPGWPDQRRDLRRQPIKQPAMSQHQQYSGPPGTPGSAPCPAASAQHAYLNAEYFSQALGRSQPYGCFLPPAWERGEYLYPLLILLHGVAGDWHDWERYTRITRYLTGKPLIVVCPDGGDGWYSNAVNNGERREDDIIEELLPHLEAAYPVTRGGRAAIGGLSMGGYGAVKLALKYPRHFPIAFSHSGAFDITLRPDRHPVFGEPDNDASFRRRENPAWLAEQALCRLPLERPKLYLDCGASDPLLEANRGFSSHLNYIGYGHTYREMPGHHTWPYWDRAFRTVLPELLTDLEAGGFKADSASGSVIQNHPTHIST